MNELINLMYQIKDLSTRTNEIALIDLQPRLMAVYDNLESEKLSICDVVKSFTAEEVADMLVNKFTTIEEAIQFFDMKSK